MAPSLLSRATKTLLARQSSGTAFVAVPASYSGMGSSPPAGVVAAIVIGSVAGFLVLLYLVYCVIHGGLVLVPLGGSRSRRSLSPSSMTSASARGGGGGGGGGGGSDTQHTASSAPRRPRSHKRHRSRRHSSSRGSARGPETVHVRRSTTVIIDPPRPPPPPPQTPPAAAAPRAPPVVVVDARPPAAPSSLLSSSWSSRTRSPSPPSVARPRPPRVVPASVVSGLSTEDEIVVMEEHSPPRRPSGRYRRDSPDHHGRGGRRY